MYNLYSTDILNFGIECIFNNVIEELTKLVTEGVVLTINGEEKKVFFVCGSFIGNEDRLF